MSPYRSAPPQPVEPKTPWWTTDTARRFAAFGAVAAALAVLACLPGHDGYRLLCAALMFAAGELRRALGPWYAARRARIIDRKADEAIAAFDRRA